MSRYACELYDPSGKLFDDNCVIGYDEMINSFFFQSGEENEQGEPLIWLGKRPREFKTLTSLLKKFLRKGLTLKIHQDYVAELSRFNQYTLLQKLFRNF